MRRGNWRCPGCRTVFEVADTTDLILCSDCRVDSAVKPQRRKNQSTWAVSDVAFVAIGLSVLLGVAVLGGRALLQAVPTSDPEKALVEKWLKENLADGKWEEVKWFPAASPQNLYDMNLKRIIESMEKAKIAYERGHGGSEEDLAEFQKHYHKFRERGVRTFCAMKFRVTTLNGEAKTLRSQVFEIVNGEAKPCSGNEIVEVPSSPLKRPSPPQISYDGLKFFEDRDYDPFPVVATENFDERAQVAMIWKAPAPAKATLAAARLEPQPQRTQFPHQAPVAANIPAISPNNPKPESQTQKSEAKSSETIPANFREYLDRAAEVQSSEIKKLEKRISDFDARLRGVKKLDEKTALKERIRQTEDALAELKRSNATAVIPEKPVVGDIGLLQVIEVIEVIDEKTLILRWLPNGKGRRPQIDVAIHPIDTNEIKSGDSTINADLLKVTETKGEPSDVLTTLKDAGKGAEFVGEPVDNDEIEKWRAQFEKENRKK